MSVNTQNNDKIYDTPGSSSSFPDSNKPGTHDMSEFEDEFKDPTTTDPDKSPGSHDMSEFEKDFDGSPLDNPDPINGTEGAFYNAGPGPENKIGGIGSLKNKKGAYGIFAILFLTVVLGLFSFLQLFQLIHFSDLFDRHFNSHTKRILNKRAAKHYAIIFNEDGKGYYKKTGFGKISNTYSKLSPQKLVEDLEKKGIDIKINETDGKLTLNGKPMEGKISDQRSAVKQILAQEYPNDGFIKRNRRTAATFKAFGIKRTFFENTKRKVANWELEQIKKIRDRQKTNSGGDSARALIDTEEGDPNSEIDQQAAKLDDPSYNPETDPNAPKPQQTLGQIEQAVSDINAGDVAEAGKNTLRKNTARTAANVFRVDGLLQFACGIKKYFKDLQLGIQVVAYSSIIKYTLPILVAADQLKTGDGKTGTVIHGSEVSGLLKVLNREPGIGKSGTYQAMTGNESANISDESKTKFSLDKTTGLGGVITTVNNWVAQYGGGATITKEYCITSGKWQYGVGMIAVNLVLMFTGVGEGISVTNAAIGAGVSILTGLVTELSKPIIIQLVSGSLINGYNPGDQSFDALAAGAMMLSSSQRYKLGGRATSAEKTAEISKQIAQEQKEEVKHMGIYDRYFAINKTDSLAFMTLMRIPSQPKQAAQSAIINTANMLNPINLVNKTVKAGDTSNSDPFTKIQTSFGVQNYELSDADLDSLPDPLDAEKWISDNNKWDDYKDWSNKCHPKEGDSLISEGIASTEDEEYQIAECGRLEDDKTRMFTAQYLDRTIAAGINFQSGQSECLDPDSDDPNCPFDDGTGVGSSNSSSDTGAVTGSADYTDNTSVTIKNGKFIVDAAIAEIKASNSTCPWNEGGHCRDTCLGSVSHFWNKPPANIFVAGQTAKDAYDAAMAKGKVHKDKNIPIGAVMWADTSAMGHAYLYIGGGKVISTDIKETDKIDIAPAGDVAGEGGKWGAPFLGWSDPNEL